MPRVGRTDHGVFQRSAHSVFKAGPLEADETIASSMRLSLTIAEVIHSLDGGAKIEDLTVDKTIFFDEGLLIHLNRILRNETGFVHSPDGSSLRAGYGMKAVSSVVRGDTVASHPGWSLYGTIPPVIGLSDNFTWDFSQTATGARFAIGEHPISIGNGGLLIETDADGGDLNGLVFYRTKFPLTLPSPLLQLAFAITFTSGLSVQSPGVMSRVQFRGWLNLDPIP